MNMRAVKRAILALILALPVQPAVAADTPAKQLFGAMKTPSADLEARAIGSYARGCMAGAIALPINGPSWQVMRLSRNRNWGTPHLVDFLERLAKAAPGVGWKGLLVGDMAQPRGGPMLTGHASHQIGLDADIWLTPMPARELSRGERESMSAVSMLDKTGKAVDPAVFTDRHFAILRLAASQPEVARIFVNPAIKKALCREAGNDRGWLRTVRPMWGHNYHFHIRMGCPAGMAGCEEQDEPPEGDGCGAELDRWLSMQHKAMFAPKAPAGPKKPPPPPMSVDALPPMCREVLVTR